MDDQEILIHQALEAQKDLPAGRQDMTAVEQFAFQKDFCQIPKESTNYTQLIPKTTPGPGQQYAFEVNLDQCTGCKACVTACHNENGLEEDETWRSVGLIHGVTTEGPAIQHVTSACHHCLEPACMHGCPVKAYEKDPETGIVKHLDDQCIGCQYCIFKCPYDAPKYNKKKGIVHKCDMCISRLNVGEAPACVRACPNEAIRITLIDTTKVKEAPKEFVNNIPEAPDSHYTMPTTRYLTSKNLSPQMTSINSVVFEPQHPHIPLVVMLVLTQLSVGAFFVEQLLSHTLEESMRILLLPTHAFSALGIGLLALGASLFHLGRPLYAFRAVLGLRKSWLSREILAFGIFSQLSFVYALQTKLSFLGGDLLAWTVLATGFGAVFCSVMVYRDTHRALWDTPMTSFRFFMTAAILGTASILAVSLSVCAFNQQKFIYSLQAIGVPLATMMAFFSAAKIFTEAFMFSFLRQRPMTPLKKSLVLMIGPLRTYTIQRFVYGIVGGIVMPVLLIGLQAYLNTVWVLLWIWAMVLVTMAAEMMERYLFFRAVIPLKMPL